MESKMNDGWKNADKEGVERILAMVKNGQDPYKLEREALVAQYKALDRGSRQEFALNYSFGWHALNQKLHDIESKQALYLLVLECIAPDPY